MYLLLATFLLPLFDPQTVDCHFNLSPARLTSHCPVHGAKPVLALLASTHEQQSFAKGKTIIKKIGTTPKVYSSILTVPNFQYFF